MRLYRKVFAYDIHALIVCRLGKCPVKAGQNPSMPAAISLGEVCFEVKALWQGQPFYVLPVGWQGLGRQKTLKHHIQGLFRAGKRVDIPQDREYLHVEIGVVLRERPDGKEQVMRVNPRDLSGL